MYILSFKFDERVNKLYLLSIMAPLQIIPQRFNFSFRLFFHVRSMFKMNNQL